MLRDERELLNAVLVEQPNGDFGHVVARQFFVDAYQVPLYEALCASADGQLAAIAAKATKEAHYHLRYSSNWVVRLGDGTDESHRRMQAAIDARWPFTADLFAADEVEDELVAAGVAADPALLRPAFDATVSDVLTQATLSVPDDPYQRIGGRTGFHTEYLGHLLPEMQSLYRAHPGASW
jgi:ring-1,2-phenylacetyl-CoA epoxidase subunit PaaC